MSRTARGRAAARARAPTTRLRLHGASEAALEINVQMTRARTALRYLCLLAVVLVSSALGTIPPPNRKPMDIYTNVIPHIQCDVCRAAMDDAARQARALHDLHRTFKEPEDRFIAIADQLCLPDFPQGRWIQWFDIEGHETTYKLRQLDYLGECGKACRTVHKACVAQLDEALEDLGPQLWRERPADGAAGTDALAKQYCARVCARKVKPDPRAAEFASEPIYPADERLSEMRDMLRANTPEGQILHVLTDEDIVDPEL